MGGAPGRHGMSVSDLRQYVANGHLGPAAGEQIRLLAGQERRLVREADDVALRQRYARLELDYWSAVQAGEDARVELLSTEARAPARQWSGPRSSSPTRLADCSTLDSARPTVVAPR